MTFVELTKLGPVSDPVFPSISWEDAHLGGVNPGYSLPDGYTITGYLLEPPEIGKGLRILRVNRNGVQALGFYQSSPLRLIEGCRLETLNSVYRLRSLQQTDTDRQATLSLLRDAGLLEGFSEFCSDRLRRWASLARALHRVTRLMFCMWTLRPAFRAFCRTRAAFVSHESDAIVRPTTSASQRQSSSVRRCSLGFVIPKGAGAFVNSLRSHTSIHVFKSLSQLCRVCREISNFSATGAAQDSSLSQALMTIARATSM